MPKSDSPTEKLETINSQSTFQKDAPMETDVVREDDSVDNDDAIAIAIQIAEDKKNQGNDEYKKKKYQQAIEHYTEAINLNPLASYYGNRSAAYMMLYSYDFALQDARKSTQIDPLFAKGFYREAKCQLQLGEVGPALHLYTKVLELDPRNKAAANEFNDAFTVQGYYNKALQAINDKQEYRTAVYNLDKCIQTCPDCCKFKILKAECFTFLHRYSEAQDIASDMLRLDGSNVDAIYVRGMCLYYMDNSEKAFQHFRKVLEMAPDHAKAKIIYKKAKSLIQKKEEGNAAFKMGKAEEALKLYTQALLIDPNNKSTNSKLYFNRAAVNVKLNRHQASVDDCTKAILLDQHYIKAYQRRAKCYMDLEDFDDAVRDYETVCKLDKTRDNKLLLQNAKLELKKSKRKDYYKLLSVSKDSSDDQIKKAYRKHALLHHPDRHSNENEDKKKEEERKFKEIGEAYAVLSDPKKKARYDSGQDLEEINGGGCHGGFPGGNIDPNLIFQSFFGGMGGGGGGGGFPGANGSGFTFQFG